LLFQLARYFKRYYMRLLTNRVNSDVRAGLLDNLFTRQLSSLSQEHIGDLMSRMIGDVDQVGSSIQSTITEVWDSVLLMLSYFVACLYYHPQLTLLAAIPIPFAFLIAEKLRRPLYTLSQKNRQALSKINVHLRHNVTGIALLRLFGLESSSRERYDLLLRDQYKWQVLTTMLQGGVGPFYTFAATLGIIIVVGRGGEYVVQGVWSIGDFTAYLAMFSAMATRTNVWARVMNTWHGASASWDRICEKLAVVSGQIGSAEVHPDAAGAEGLKVGSLSFSYPFANEESIRDISFTAHPGQIIGITGPVGSGKSALAAVLSGLYDYSGHASLAGREVRGLGAERSAFISWMDSQHFVFSDDVLFNIALGRDSVSSLVSVQNTIPSQTDVPGDPEATPDAWLAQAIALAALNQDIASFDEGMQTRLMERGVRVSGGQRQRIALARAWYGSSQLVILDDPFSAIDINMERQIMANIRAEIGDRIVLLFSHRLAAFSLTDRVLVLNKGCLTEYGSHDELLQQRGLYWSIFTAQNVLRGEAAGGEDDG